MEQSTNAFAIDLHKASVLTDTGTILASADGVVLTGGFTKGNTGVITCGRNAGRQPSEPATASPTNASTTSSTSS